MRSWLLFVLLLGVFALGRAYDRVIPNKPAEYTIRSKTACLPDDGVNFKLAYRGTGEATFVVLPPEPTTTTVETKEKK